MCKKVHFNVFNLHIYGGGLKPEVPFNLSYSMIYEGYGYINIKSDQG